MRKHLALFLWIALALCAPMGAAGAEVAEGGAADASLRVLLESLGGRRQLHLTLTGPYAAEGEVPLQLAAGTQLRVGAGEDRLLLRTGGVTMSLGQTVTLRRQTDAAGTAGGLIIDEADKDALYGGDLTISLQEGSLRLILAVDVEEYLCGVLPYEMSDAFPLEALKAQAVAARTYAMQRKARGAGAVWDLTDTANDQVYRGRIARYANAARAVEETRGVVGLYKGAFAECFYSASNGGQTALAENTWGQGDFGYLDTRDDPYDLENPESVVRRFRVPKDLTRLSEPLYGTLLAEIGPLLYARGDITQRDAVGLAALVSLEATSPLHGESSRQYTALRFTLQANTRRVDEEGAMGALEVLEAPVVTELSVYGLALDLLGLRVNSQNYDMVSVTETEDAFVIESRRYGHGVGLSQRGAQWMADRYGQTAWEILAFYYPGMEWTRYAWTNLPPPTEPEQPLSLMPTPAPTPLPTQAPLPAPAPGETVAVVVLSGDAAATLNVRAGPSLQDEVIGTLRNGWRLLVRGTPENGWVPMRAADLEGYVSETFITPESAGETGGGSVPAETPRADGGIL